MSGKIGRPTDSPKISQLAIRIDKECCAILADYCKKNNVNRSQAVREIIKRNC